jgi:hypothetical protein
MDPLADTNCQGFFLADLPLQTDDVPRELADTNCQGFFLAGEK